MQRARPTGVALGVPALQVAGVAGTGSAPHRLRLLTDESRQPGRAGLPVWWWIGLAQSVAVGVLLVSVAFLWSREQRSGALLLFWAGLLVAVIPAVLTIAFGRPSRTGYAAIVLLLGVGLYLVKVAHSPFQFTFADELSHIWNADRMAVSGRLPAGNAALPITTRFPGLEVLTSGLAQTARIGTFSAGLIVIGVARCVFSLGLFCLFELITRSSRIGALAAAFYVLDPEFLYWSAQYSYQSLALPLGIVVLVAALARRRGHFASQRRDARPWTAVGAIVIAAVAVTHHMTSYMLALALLLTMLVSFVSDRRWWRAPWDLALLAAAAAAAWLVFQATLVESYLGDIFRAAYDSIVAILSGAALPRKPFQSTVYDVPLLERGVAIAGLLVVVGLVVVAARRRRRRAARSPVELVCWLACVGYLGSYGLRFVPSAWEIANRASEFLLVGTSVVLALSGAHLILKRRLGTAGIAVFAVIFGLAFASGVISGWPPPALLASPMDVAVGHTTIQPQGFATAAWARTNIPSGTPMIADQSNGRLLLTIAHQFPYFGTNPDAQRLLKATSIDEAQLYVLRHTKARYIVIDRRKIAQDTILGYFFDRADRPIATIPAGVWEKFDHASWTDLVFDSGNILIYRVREVPRAAA
jgi:hypothetical protein